MKFEVVFGLESAGWPSLIVDHGAIIREANPLAVSALGAVAETPLVNIWSRDNELSPEAFLAKSAQTDSPLLPVRLHGKNGQPLAFHCLIFAAEVEGKKKFILQFFADLGKSNPAVVEKPVEVIVEKIVEKIIEKPVEKIVEKVIEVEKIVEKTGDRNPATDGLAQKQKLDCALQLARTVSLDFNNALTSILGHTSLLLSQIEPSHPWRNSLIEVEKSAAKAAEIANDLGTFSRQEKEVRALAVKNLNQIVNRTVEMFQGSTGAAVSWKLQLERKLYAAKFDEAKMQQALQKVLENSVQALGSQNGRISVQTRNMDLTEATQDLNARLAAGCYVCVEISDNGSGIEPDILPKIFEPFFTTKKGGTHRGLGLAWVYGIVTNHGGGVAVSSQPSVGTSVRVYLPAERRFILDNSVKPEELKGDQTILMVDDEELLLTMGQTILSQFGYHVLTANSGQRALEIIAKAEAPIHLVITDLVMPNMSGRELMEQIALASPDTRIICTSGYVWPASKVEEARYLQKPFTSQELLTKVKQALELEPASVD